MFHKLTNTIFSNLLKAIKKEMINLRSELIVSLSETFRILWSFANILFYPIWLNIINEIC
jgi:hypothetical protein